MEGNRIQNDVELEEMLAEEKSRCDRLQLEYRSLKEEYRRLQGDHVVMQAELKSLLDKSCRSQEEGQDALIEARHELANAHAKLEELSTQVFAPQKLKAKYKEKLENTYREKHSSLKDELERTRSENNQFRLENTLLRSEYESNKFELEQQILEMESKLVKQLEDSNTERKTLLDKMQNHKHDEVERLETMRKEMEKYRRQVKVLMEELEATKHELAEVLQQSEKMQRDGSKVLTGHIVNVNAMQLEMAAVKEQCQHYERELALSCQDNEKIKLELSQLQKDKFRLEMQLKDLEHKSKLAVVNLETEHTRSRAELQKEKDELLRQLMTAQSDLGVAKVALEYQKQLVMDRDKNALVQINVLKEKERTAAEKFLQEKNDLEASVFELERQLLGEKTKREEDITDASRRINAVEKAKQEIEKENLVMRLKLDSYKEAEKEFEQLRSEVPALLQRVSDLQSSVRNSLETEDQLVVQNRQLNSALEAARNEMKMQLRCEQESLQQIIEKHNKETHRLESNIATLDKDLHSLRTELQMTSRKLKHKVKIYMRLISKLRNKLQIANAEMEELRIEKEALRKSVPHETHTQVKKQLRNLIARQEEFHQLLQTPNLMATVRQATLYSFQGSAPGPTLSEEIIDSTEMQMLKSRLERLQADQSEQMKDLKDVISAENLKVLKEGFYKPSKK